MQQVFHTLITAEVPEAILPMLSREVLAEHLLALAGAIEQHPALGPAVAYSDRPGNGGFTGYVGCANHHITFHHWDGAHPGILQVDVFLRSSKDLAQFQTVLRAFWQPERLWHATIKRHAITKSIKLPPSYHFNTPHRPGLGAGAHQHMFIQIDRIGKINRAVTTQFLEMFLASLTSNIGMTIMIPPAVVCEEGGTSNLFGIVGITTSHICFHYFSHPVSSSMYIDVFSCKPFDPITVETGIIEALTSAPKSQYTIIRCPASAALLHNRAGFMQISAQGKAKKQQR